VTPGHMMTAENSSEYGVDGGAFQVIEGVVGQLQNGFQGVGALYGALARGVRQ
jgi:hypothetical protein